MSSSFRLNLSYKNTNVREISHLRMTSAVSDSGSQGSAPLTRVSNFSVSSGFNFPDKVPGRQSNLTNLKGGAVNDAANNTVHRVAVNSTGRSSGNPNVKVGGGGSVSLGSPSLNINHALVEALLTGQKIGKGLTKIASAIGVMPLGWTAPGIAVRAASVGIGVALYEAGTWGLNQLMNGTHQRIAGPFQKPGPIIETVPMDQPKIEPLKGQPIDDPRLPDMDIEGYNPVGSKWLNPYGGQGNGADVINTDLTRLPGTAEVSHNNPRDYIYLSENTPNSKSPRQDLDRATFPKAPTEQLENTAREGRQYDGQWRKQKDQALENRIVAILERDQPVDKTLNALMATEVRYRQLLRAHDGRLDMTDHLQGSDDYGQFLDDAIDKLHIVQAALIAGRQYELKALAVQYGTSIYDEQWLARPENSEARNAVEHLRTQGRSTKILDIVREHSRQGDLDGENRNSVIDIMNDMLKKLFTD